MPLEERRRVSVELMGGVASVDHAPQILGALSKPEERDLGLPEVPFHLGPRGAAQDFDPHRSVLVMRDETRSPPTIRTNELAS